MKKFLIILVLISAEIIACQCPFKTLSDWQKSEVKNSQCIFIGDVISINQADSTFIIKVIESLDGGDDIGNLYIGKNWKVCGPDVGKKGKWIVYGNIYDGFLTLNSCGISRSFDYPVIFPAPPPLELFEQNLTEKERDKKIQDLRSENIRKGKKDLKLELNALRKRRDKT